MKKQFKNHVTLYPDDYVIFDRENDQLITFSGGGIVIYGDKEDALRDCRGNEKVVSCTELPTKWKDVLMEQIWKEGKV
jgi:hypothetical protein